MNIMEPIWTKIFIRQTYSCIKNRGIHNVAHDLKKVLNKHPEDTIYCLKMDIKKFYPSINHDILYNIIKRKIKDQNLLDILKNIIYSVEGVPIGNYLSQFFANLYLTYFDHWVKEELKCKYYFRYADDIIILSSNKNLLRNVLITIKLYLKLHLDLQLKQNYQIFPVDSRGIDFVGYRFYHTHTLLRKSIKNRMFKLIYKKECNKISTDNLKRKLQSYFGWLKYCNSKNLLNKIYQKTNIKFSNWNGKKVNITVFCSKNIYLMDIIKYNKYFRMNFIYHNKILYIQSHDNYLLYKLNKYKLPVNLKLDNYVRTKKNRN